MSTVSPSLVLLGAMGCAAIATITYLSHRSKRACIELNPTMECLHEMKERVLKSHENNRKLYTIIYVAESNLVLHQINKELDVIEKSFIKNKSVKNFLEYNRELIEKNKAELIEAGFKKKV